MIIILIPRLNIIRKCFKILLKMLILDILIRYRKIFIIIFLIRKKYSKISNNNNSNNNSS